ncbi:MAG: hypothetical protein IKH94_06775, partial [Eubacterium sp.]|nr:hypothetical protein [Eubacterium sp.]
MKKDLVKLIASVFTMCFLLLICAYYGNAAIGKNGSGETVCRAATPSDADTTESTGTENTEDSGQNDTTENTTEATTGQEETTADGTVTDENGKPVLTEYVTD